MYGAGTIPQLTGVDMVQLLTATIFYLKCLDEGTIPQLLLKTMVIPRVCGTPSKIFYINPRPLFYPIMSV